MDKIVCVAGPTASGKTALGVALAKAFDGEVVSADSMQLYMGMDVGTAKPTAEEMDGIPHHMLDLCPVGEDYSVARYVEEADACLVDIISRNKLPIVVGGTGLYMDSLIRGLEFSAGDKGSGLRQKLEQLAEDKGIDAVREILRRNDPESYERLHPNNRKRIIRAAEIWLSTGQTITQHDRITAARPNKYQALKIALTFNNRETLYGRIDRRVDIMLENGLLDEARGLLDRWGNTTAMQAIGYKELAAYFSGQTSLDEAVETIKRQSRRYAKRQLTWLRRDPTVRWIGVDDPEAQGSVAERAINEVRTFLAASR